MTKFLVGLEKFLHSLTHSFCRHIVKTFTFLYLFLKQQKVLHLFCQHPTKCVDERCNAENAARKCGVFTYNALLLERKGCKNSIFQNSSFAPARGDIFNALPDLWSGVVRTPRLKNKENQQPLYPLPLFWRVRQRLFLSDGSRTHNLKWEP